MYGMCKIESRGIRRTLVKNFITGIGGFVASHLADYLLEQGEEVYGSYRWFEETDRIKHLIGNPKFYMIPMDLNDLSSCIKAIEDVKPDYIFHLAAQSYVTESFDYPIATIETNTIGTLKLLEAIKKVKDVSFSIKAVNWDPGQEIKKDFDSYSFDPVIHLCSSSEVYGLVKKEDIPIKETQPLNPANPYAVGKVGLDVLGQMYYNNYGMKIIRTRMFTHTGPRRTMMSAECYYAKSIAELEKQNITKKRNIDGSWESIYPKYVIKTGNMKSIRTWADVRDAVRAYYLLVRKCKPGEVYNIGGNTTKTIQEVLDYLLSISKLDRDKVLFETDPKLLRPYDVTLQIPDCSKFLNETGWKPEYTFEQTMQDLLDWWRTQV